MSYLSLSARCRAFFAGSIVLSALLLSGAHPRPAARAAKPHVAAAPTAVTRKKPAAKPVAKKPTPAGPAVGYRRAQIGRVPMQIAQVDLSRPEVRLGVAIAGNGLGYRDGWSDIINRTRPAAAITGTYFCTESSMPVGSIVVQGKSVYRGAVGTALVFKPGGGAQMISVRRGVGRDWRPYEMVLQGGPRLLTDGLRTLDPRTEGFRDPAIYARKRRTAVALTESGKLLLVAVDRPVLLRELAAALQELGATDAMCLDGGDSSGLYCRGRTRVQPARRLTNLLVVYDSKSRFNRMAGTLVPSGPKIVRGSAGDRS